MLQENSQLAPLEAVLNYDNQDVIYRFIDLYDLPYEEVDDLFRETRKWLWVSAHSLYEDHNIQLSVWKEMYMIDEMWHNFILFTEAYHNFCWQYFGQFIHHSPKTKKQKDAHYQSLAKDRAIAVEHIRLNMEQQYSYIYDKLGAATLTKWMEDYPRRYTNDFIRSIRRKAA